MIGITEIILIIVILVVLLVGGKNSKKIVKEISKIVNEIRSLKI